MRPLRALAFAFEKEKKEGEKTKERNNRGRPRSPTAGAGFNDLSIRIADFSVVANESNRFAIDFSKWGTREIASHAISLVL